MEENDKYVKGVIVKALIFLVFESVFIMLFFHKKAIPLVFGLLLGGFLNILFFTIMYKNILVALNKSEAGAKRFMQINYMVRYIISGIVLYISTQSSYLNVFTCMIGLLTIKLVLYLNNLQVTIKESKFFKKGR